jgi:hypothetical protein
MEIKFNNAFEFKIALEAGKIETPQFVHLKEYENKQSEISNYLINLGVHYGQTLQRDFAMFNFISLNDYNIPTQLQYVANVAYEEVFDSLQANTDKNRDNHTPASRRNLDMYDFITPNIKMHKRTGELYLVGMIISKKIITPGIYKERNSKDKTLVKNILTKNFASHKYRQYFLSKITSITINGNKMSVE